MLKVRNKVTKHKNDIGLNIWHRGRPKSHGILMRQWWSDLLVPLTATPTQKTLKKKAIQTAGKNNKLVASP